MKLLCDHMLGSLAKWLRILGYDTLFPSATTSDDEILRITQTDSRLLLTRDKELLKRGIKGKLPVLEIHSTQLQEQLNEALSAIPFDSHVVLTRCTLCNTPLVSVEKKGLKTLVPPKVYETRDQFWFCPTCQKYYWMGTHSENMMEKISTLPVHHQR
jgi:uncharacterized protein